jgi:hypothetical protein
MAGLEGGLRAGPEVGLRAGLKGWFHCENPHLSYARIGNPESVGKVSVYGV